MTRKARWGVRAARDFKGQAIWQRQSNYVRLKKWTHTRDRHTLQQPFSCPLLLQTGRSMCAKSCARFTARGAWILPCKKNFPSQFTNRTPFAAAKCALGPREVSRRKGEENSSLLTLTHTRGHTIEAAMFARRTCSLGPSKRLPPGFSLPLSPSFRQGIRFERISPRQKRVLLDELFLPTPTHTQTDTRAPPWRGCERARTDISSHFDTQRVRVASGIQHTRSA